jgi:hypothetical protein
VIIALLLHAAAPAGEAANMLAISKAMDTCVRVLGTEGVDEGYLLRNGWQEFVNPNDSRIRVFGHVESKAVINTLQYNGNWACMARSSGKYRPLVDSLTKRYGRPEVSARRELTWHSKSNRLFLVPSDIPGKDRMVMISLQQKVSK